MRNSTVQTPIKFKGILGQYFVNPSNFQTLSISGLTPNGAMVNIDDPADYCVTSENVVTLMGRKDLELDNFIGKNYAGTKIFHRLAKLACSLTTYNWEDSYESAKNSLIKSGKIEGFEALDVKYGNLIWLSAITVEALIDQGYLRYD